MQVIWGQLYSGGNMGKRCPIKEPLIGGFALLNMTVSIFIVPFSLMTYGVTILLTNNTVFK